MKLDSGFRADNPSTFSVTGNSLSLTLPKTESYLMDGQGLMSRFKTLDSSRSSVLHSNMMSNMYLFTYLGWDLTKPTNKGEIKSTSFSWWRCAVVMSCPLSVLALFFLVNFIQSTHAWRDIQWEDLEFGFPCMSSSYALMIFTTTTFSGMRRHFYVFIQSVFLMLKLNLDASTWQETSWDKALSRSRIPQN